MKPLSFPQIHELADVEKRTNMPLIIFFTLFSCLGIALVVYSSSNPDTGLGMTGLFVGVAIIIANLMGIIAKNKQWVYIPTHSPLYRESVEMDVSGLNSLRRQLGEIVPGVENIYSDTEKGRILLDSIYSKDGGFAAFQISQYTSLMYTPIMEICCLEGGKASEYVKLLKKELTK